MTSAFADLFGRPADLTAEAPGRVNLIGEHTDYSEGFVLPAVIPHRTVVALGRRSDRRVRAVSLTGRPPGRPPADYQIGAERPTGTWVDYLQGVTAVLAASGHAQRLSGFDACITSTVPLGAGLSSSASFEVAVLRALRGLFSLPIDDLALARLGQRVETDFVGAPVGVMDQLAASLGNGGSALFIDTRSLAFEQVPLPDDAELVVINSGVTHDHASGAYRQRRTECESAAAALGCRVLRDSGRADLARIARLPAPLDRRARHVVTENARVLDAVAALRAGDLAGLGALLAAGHASLRDDFEVSVPEIDLLVELASATEGVLGARLTGGGFGGSIVVLATRHAAAHAGAAIADRYRRATGRTATVLRLREG
jgi:galactokinase